VWLKKSGYDPLVKTQIKREGSGNSLMVRSWSPGDRLPGFGGPVTCIIGMFYDSGKGAVVIADSRTMIGGDYSHDRKLFEVDEGIVFAASGLSGIAGKLLENVTESRMRSRQYMPSECVNVFEDEMAELYSRYKMTKPFRFGSDENLLSGLIGFIEDEKPKLYCLYENGYAEAIRNFHSVGHGARHASNILRTLYTPSLSKDRAIEIGVHALIEVSKIDAMVDGSPQIAVLGHGVSSSGLNILNCDRDHFDFECPEIEKVKKKVEGIEHKRTQVFHLLIDGKEEVKRKLDEALNEYENAKSAGGGTRKRGERAEAPRGGSETAGAG
jgi:20S proteasome alpha/beta subunit